MKLAILNPRHGELDRLDAAARNGTVSPSLAWWNSRLFFLDVDVQWSAQVDADAIRGDPLRLTAIDYVAVDGDFAIPGM